MAPEEISDGMAVIYWPSPCMWFRGFVDGRPWKLGDTWVVRLRDMELGYAKFTGKRDGRDWVNAAALNCLEQAEEEQR